MKTRVIIVAIVVLSLFISSFKLPVYSGDKPIYIYLTYIDHSTTNKVLLCSDVLRYDDWKKNSLAISERFAAEAITQHQIDVWTPAIEFEGLLESIDQTTTVRERKIHNYCNWEKGYNRPCIVKRVALNRL